MKKMTTSLFVIVLVLGIVFLLGSSGCEKKLETDDTVTGATENLNVKDEYSNIIEDDEKISKDDRKYNWSTMREGPYKDKVSYATSTDLLNWVDSGIILAEHASVPGAISKDGKIYVYFVDVSEKGKAEQIGLITSIDKGKTWGEKQIVSITGIGNKVPVDPDPYLMDDGRIRLYYFNINTPKNPSAKFKIYSAISKDGMNFIEEPGVRFAGEGTLDPDVVKVGDVWRLYTGRIEDSSVVVATSSDGLNFSEEKIAYKGSAVPNVFYKDSVYYLYTAGINIAKSANGVAFTDTGKTFQSGKGVTADPSVVELGDGSYMMFYKTSEGMPGGGVPDPGLSSPPEASSLPSSAPSSSSPTSSSSSQSTSLSSPSFSSQSQISSSQSPPNSSPSTPLSN